MTKKNVALVAACLRALLRYGTGREPSPRTVAALQRRARVALAKEPQP